MFIQNIYGPFSVLNRHCVLLSLSPSQYIYIANSGCTGCSLTRILQTFVHTIRSTEVLHYKQVPCLELVAYTHDMSQQSYCQGRTTRIRTGRNKYYSTGTYSFFYRFRSSCSQAHSFSFPSNLVCSIKVDHEFQINMQLDQLHLRLSPFK